MIKWYWLSCKSFTVGVQVKDDIIIKTPPIVKKFKGQNINNLVNWCKKIGNFEACTIDEGGI